jgi:hypothetical protein
LWEAANYIAVFLQKSGKSWRIGAVLLALIVDGEEPTEKHRPPRRIDIEVGPHLASAKGDKS